MRCSEVDVFVLSSAGVFSMSSFRGVFSVSSYVGALCLRSFIWALCVRFFAGTFPCALLQVCFRTLVPKGFFVRFSAGDFSLCSFVKVFPT